MADDRFSIWLSMAARDRPIKSRIGAELGRAGFWRKVGARPNFSGVRIGRGAGVGRVLAAGAGPNRRVATDTRVIRLQRSQPTASVRNHLRYLVRSHEPEERRPLLYGLDTDAPDPNAFARACRDDRHQFRLVVGSEDGCEYEDLRPLVRRLMTQVARDLRTPLDWVAADHHDTAVPHSHIVIRGVDRDGGDLVIAREYIEHGFQKRAADLVALDLGPQREQDIERSQQRRLQIALEGPTPIDRDLVGLLDGQGRVFPDHPDRWRQADRMGRLQTLQTLGLAQPDGQGRWYVQPDLVARLGEIEWRNRTARSRDLTGPALAHEQNAERFSPSHDGDAARAAMLLPDRDVSSGLDAEDRHFRTLERSLTPDDKGRATSPDPMRKPNDLERDREPLAPIVGAADVGGGLEFAPISRLIRQRMNDLGSSYDPS